jgi:hypothetical protein
LTPVSQQDEELIRLIQERNWEETFETQAYGIDMPKLRAAIEETIMLHHQLISTRGKMRLVRPSLQKAGEA